MGLIESDTHSLPEFNEEPSPNSSNSRSDSLEIYPLILDSPEIGNGGDIDSVAVLFMESLYDLGSARVRIGYVLEPGSALNLFCAANHPVDRRYRITHKKRNLRHALCGKDLFYQAYGLGIVRQDRFASLPTRLAKAK